ncbi:MAG: histidine kinase [Cryomorphaceae bacterium]|nr:histidine kinase [Cryomorphaceae bacterium]
MKNNRGLPLLLGLFVGVLLVIAIPFEFSKYTLVPSQPIQAHRFKTLLVSDVTSDGNHEVVLCGGKFHSDIEINGCLMYGLNNEKHISSIGQVNIGKFVDRSPEVFTADYDKDGYHEIYMLGYRENTLFLTGYEGPISKGPFIQIYIDSFEFHQGYAHLNIVFFGQYDTDGDGYDELFFTVRNSYPVYPRKLYRLNVVTKELVHGPSVGFAVTSTQVFDTIGSLYFTGSSSVTMNFTARRDIPLPDTSGYVYVYDQNLNFVFDPIPVVFGPARCKSFILKDYIITFWQNLQFGNAALEKRELKTGRLIDKLTFEGVAEAQLYLFNKESIILRLNDTIFSLDEKLLVKNRHVDIRMKNLITNKFDLRFPLVYKLSDGKTLVFLDEDFSGATETQFDANLKNQIHSLRSDNKEFYLVLDDENKLWLLSYAYNPYYILKWLYYSLIVLLGMGLTHLIFKKYRKKIELKWEQERELGELQFLSLKNQVDAHFMVNALTSIDWMYRNKNTEKAHKFLGNLSKMMGNFLAKSNRIKISLHDELSLCKSFCDAHTYMNERFRYEIIIGDDIDPAIISIPNQIVFTHVENALKHAFPFNDRDMELKVKVSKTASKYIVQVIDNGIGYNKNPKSSGSKKGILMAERISSLYNNLFSKKVDFNIFLNETGGTRVEIFWER